MRHGSLLSMRNCILTTDVDPGEVSLTGRFPARIFIASAVQWAEQIMQIDKAFRADISLQVN